MSTDQYRNFMGYLWFQKEDNIYTIGINEEGIEEISEIIGVDFPKEGEEIEADVVCGSVETDDGPLDIYSPVSGDVIEVNTAVIEDPSQIQEDPYEAWLIKIESDEEVDSLGDDDDDDDDKDDKDEEEEDMDEDRPSK